MSGKRILILSNNGLGLYKFRKELIEAMISHGNTVILAFPFDEYKERLTEELGCECIDTPLERRGTDPAKDLSLLNEYTRLMKRVKPSIVITYTIKPNIYGGLAAKSRKIPYYSNITGLGTAFHTDGMMKALVTALYKAALSKASHVFFENAENRNIFLSLGIIPENITTILNGAGVNTNYYSFQTYPDPESVPIKFLFIGRIMAEKGINELFEAARRIKAEKINAEVNIAGYFDDDYKKQTEALCDEGIIRYLGFHDDVRPLLKETHCFILPSYHEGMANTVLEAASSGRPLIVSDISGCREAVENGENGLLIEPHSVESLFSAMKSFAELSNDIRISMGEESRRIAVNKFDKNKVVDMVMEVIGL